MKTTLAARRFGLWLPVAACASAALLGWLGYRAIRDSERSSTLLAQRTAQDAANLLADALLRDMRAVQSAVLASHEWNQFSPDHSYRFSRLVASAFAQYPYPESFFAWREPAESTTVVFWSRTDRPPSWTDASANGDTFPVLTLTEPTVGRRLIDRIMSDASKGQSYSVFDIHIGLDLYQVVVSMRYDDPYRERLVAVIGFLVNLGWVRHHYFADVTNEIARVVGPEPGLALAVLDERGQVSASSARYGDSGIGGHRQFSLSFFDPLSLPPARPPDLADVRWTAQAVVRPNGSFFNQTNAAGPTLILAATATLFLVVGLFLTARAVRENANLAETRSAFVATVTHELKTPVAAIRAAGDTLASGRIAGPEALRDYAILVVNEAKRLTRLLNNLLAYARITDLTEIYSFQSFDLADVIDTSLREFRSRLDIGTYQVRVDIQPDLPEISGDRTALGLMFDNILDNAIRYSKDNRVIDINAQSSERDVILEVVDRGIGIPPGDLEHVTEKFFRGHNVNSEGSGLGLAITERIVADHGGSLRIQSTVGVGTTVSVRFPAEKDRYETPDSNSRRRRDAGESASGQS